jgi:hypothetical protein
MNYTVQLVHVVTGKIDTVETVVDKPAFGKIPTAMNIHLTVDTVLEDVYLRVIGNVTGVSDSNYHFTDERMFGTYPSDSDGYLAMKKTLALALPGEQGLSVVAPFANPVQNSTFDAGFYYPAGGAVTLELDDMLGRNVMPAMQFTSNGAWQSATLPTPNASGSYLLRVTAGDNAKSYLVIVNR